MRVLIAAICIACSVVSAGAQTKMPVDLLLVLASDVSRSVDAHRFQLQREGYAAALADATVLAAMTSGRHRRIGLIFFEWAGLKEQTVVIPWTVIDGADAAKRFADALIEAPRKYAGRTSISAAITFAMKQIEEAPYSAERIVIDISGDGTNNAGASTNAPRDEAVKRGYVINGLAILSDVPMPWNPEHTHPPGGLEQYFKDHVRAGPGSFVIAAKNHEAFKDAIRKKLIQEIAHLLPQ